MSPKEIILWNEMIKSKAKLDYDFLLTDHSLRVAPLWKADDFATLFSSRWPSPGSSMAGSVWHLPAHHGAGERCDQPGAARPRMVQSKEIVQRLVTLSNARHGAKSCRFFSRFDRPKPQEEMVEIWASAEPATGLHLTRLVHDDLITNEPHFTSTETQILSPFLF